MRPMTTEDLGDPRVFEDEAIREQAAALQIHVENLIERVLQQQCIHHKTQYRIWRLWSKCSNLNSIAGKLFCDNKL